MRNRQKLTPLTTSHLELLPEINLRVGVIGRNGVVGRDITAEDNVPVMLTPINHGRGILIRRKGGEDSRFVVSFGGCFNGLPGVEVILALCRFVITEVAKVFDQRPVLNIGS